MAAGLASTWWQYLLLFLAVAASWAGVPVIGTAALGAAAVAASQDKLDLAAAIVVAMLAGEVGGLGGYAIGRRWGRQLLERPGQQPGRSSHCGDAALLSAIPRCAGSCGGRAGSAGVAAA